MKDQIFGVLQRVGRSFMLPIAILPVAGLLLGIGSSFTNATTISTYHLESILGDGTVLNALLLIMSKAGNVIFDNLPLIFAVGVAIGMAKEEKEVSALSALIAFTRTLLLRGGLVLVMPVFFGVDGVWWSVAAAELLGVVLSVVLLVLMRRRYHYA